MIEKRNFMFFCTQNKIYEKIRKKYALLALFDFKTIDFCIEGHTLKTNCIRFFILLTWRKNMYRPFWKSYMRVFSFFHPFSLRFIWKQCDFVANKRAFKHCTPPIMVSLASYTDPGPILIPKWVQKTTKERQDLHIPKYHHFHPSFLALLLHFFSITCCKWIF